MTDPSRALRNRLVPFGLIDSGAVGGKLNADADSYGEDAEREVGVEDSGGLMLPGREGVGVGWLLFDRVKLEGSSWLSKSAC